MILDDINYTAELELEDVKRLFFVKTDGKFNAYTFMTIKKLCTENCSFVGHNNTDMEILDKGIAIEDTHDNISKIFDNLYAGYFYRTINPELNVEIIAIEGSPNPEHKMPIINFSKQNYYKFKFGIEF